MSLDSTTSILLDRWQQLHFEDIKNKNNFSKAEILRNLLAQTEYARARHELSDDGASLMFSRLSEEYAEIVDTPEENKGLNNYASSFLSAVVGCRNESQIWKSSLNPDNISNMSCVQKFLSASKAENDLVSPSGNQKDPVDWATSTCKVLPSNPEDAGPLVKTGFLAEPTSKSSSELENGSKVDAMTGSRVPSGFDFVRKESSSYESHSTSGESSLWKMNKHPRLDNPRLDHPRSDNSRLDHPRSDNSRLDYMRSDNSRLDHPRSDNSRLDHPRSDNSRLDHPRSDNLRLDHPRSDNSRLDYMRSDNSRLDHPRSDNSRLDHPRSDNSRLDHPRSDNSRLDHLRSDNSRLDNSTLNGSDSFYSFSGKSAKRFNESCDGGKNQFSTSTQNAQESEESSLFFRTAKQQLLSDQQKKYGSSSTNRNLSSAPTLYGSNKKSLGARRGAGGKFVPPIMNRDSPEDDSSSSAERFGGTNEEPSDPRLKNIEPRMIELIMSEIMDHGTAITWNDIAGLEFVKKTIKEIVVWPMLRPDIFTGLRGPPKGLLLFGPPGTGKTLIGKCIASQSRSTFFSISASSLTSKWVGEGEKMVRALFLVARVHQPAVVFIDEIDSLLSQRSDGEHESSRRIKTEFLVQLDGTTTGENDRVLVVGATNRPQEIDEAARRRFVKRLYIPLPEVEARKQIVRLLMEKQNHSLNTEALDTICIKTEGYSGADMANLCREAALGPIRSLDFSDIENITADEVRPISFQDFTDALKQVRASVSDKDLNLYIDWNKQYGSWDV